MRKKMKNKKLKLVLLLAVLAAAISTVSLMIFLPNEDSVHVELSWSEKFDNINEMLEGSDLVIKGMVVEGNPEIRQGVPFTRQKIQVEDILKGVVKKDEIIEVLQTGGEYEGSFMMVDALPLLSKGDSYFLCLKQTDPDQRYGQYYLIAGGFQGVAQLGDDGKLYAITDVENYTDTKKSISQNPNYILNNEELSDIIRLLQQ